MTIYVIFHIILYSFSNSQQLVTMTKYMHGTMLTQIILSACIRRGGGAFSNDIHGIIRPVTLSVLYYNGSAFSLLVVRRLSSSLGTHLLVLRKRNHAGQVARKLSAHRSHFPGNQGYHQDRRAKSHLDK